MLAKSRRLRLTRDFERVFAVRRATNGVFFRAKTLSNNLNISRFAIVISGKVHKRAVVRNKVRRRAWTVIKELLYQIPAGHDIVLIATTEAAKADFADLRQELNQILTKRL